MTRLALLAALAALAMPAAASAESPLGTFPNCTTGVPMAAQAWDISPDQEAEHIHTEACMPFLQTLTQPVTIDVQTLAHDNDGTMTFLRAQDQGTTIAQVNMSWTPGVTLAAARVDQLTIDPAKFAHSGWQELRLASNFNDPAKGRWYTTSRYCIFVNNGKSRSDYCGGPTTSGRCGWAAHYGEYFNVYLDCRDYNRLLQGPIFAGQTLRIKGDTSRLVATIDPDFHHGYAGQVIYDGAGSSSWHTVTIPAGLAPGVHRLHIRSEKTRTSAPKGTFAGAGVVTFTVPA